MSYCVNCGVELNPSTQNCPLCGTKVVNPKSPPDTELPPFFPTYRPEVAPVPRRAVALLMTAMLASVSMCCLLLNLALKPQMKWSLFVAGAAAMLWVWLVLPLLVNRWVPLWGRLTIDVGAVAVYVAFIALAMDGWEWFLGLAVPILGVAAVVVCCLSWLLQRGHSTLTSAMLSLNAVGVFCVGMEICGDLYFLKACSLGWSLIVLVSCVGFSIPLLIIRWVPSLREEARRRFHL